MAKFTKNDVYSAVVNMFVYGEPGDYIKLRDLVYKDARKTGYYAGYEKFMAYSDTAMIAYVGLLKLIGAGLLDGEDTNEVVSNNMMA